MSTVGIPVRLWCLVRGSSSAFKVVIGDGNDIDDLKEAISNKLPNDVKAIQLVLWSVNIDQSQIKATSIDDILNDEDKLEISGLTIGEAFPSIEGNNVRVIVEVPVFAGEL
ncbi:hypothetical protein C1645_24766 [Glomus cerebriforme]|uniref:Crinkler effector protein N-terminal domain-containing protein n=1 Tax=Glomus cerebriforme TaxID=658196 RepID=A0A397S0L6_9GLOM|nr:hypothetical protein C1645_24766 [Glomus cerebriforme]